MNKIAIKTTLVKEALKSYTKDMPTDLLKDDKGVVTISFTEENKDLLDFLEEHIPMTHTQRAKVSAFLFKAVDNDTLGKLTTTKVSGFFKYISFFNQSLEPVIEIKIADKWYPVLATTSKFTTFMGGTMVEITAYAMLGATQYARTIYIGDWDFKSPSDQVVKKSVNEVLKAHNVRLVSPEALAHGKKLSDRVIEFSNYTAKVFDGHGTGLSFNNYYGWMEVNVGWKEAPSTVIVEPMLENQYGNRDIANGSTWHLPFVRVFSLKHKAYMYVDLENIEEHVFHRDGKSKIVLPQNMFTALESIFNAKQEAIFGDLFHGRHGGIVVLANGPSGVGKTLTAEVFAEFQERPLYSMEMSEIGTSLKEVEVNLQKIFTRAKKWNAVLLFDEADIFLSERVASDLERSAIVGVFLRLLDYYEGTFFLTTNRGEGIDKAFKSRVTLYLDYPELSIQTRQSIWNSMLQSAGLEVTVDHVTWLALAQANLNGRQIRNQVRLLKLMYPDNNVKTSQIKDSLAFAAR